MGKVLAAGIICVMIDRALARHVVRAMHGPADQLPAVLVIETENPSAWIMTKPRYTIQTRIWWAEFHFDSCDAHIVVLHSSPHGFAVEETRLVRDHFAIADQA
ncbi:hypothetical protein C5615_32705 [Burkholderia cepacia]|uniref:Uncharacterized protein n=1 Tax=Burkholderia cepacia TaxID=292 RepID=A0A2S8I800_BURCE|nr:hypothetical protein C5615_32705 [Burkholderia cepacia]